MDTKLVKELTDTVVKVNEVEQNISMAVAKFRDELRELHDKEKNLHEAVKASMEKYDVRKFENEVLKITYIAPTVRNSIDTARLKEEKPEIASEYMKQSQVKSSIRIKVKELI